MKNKLKLWLKFELSKRDGFVREYTVPVYGMAIYRKGKVEVKNLIYLKMKDWCQNGNHKFKKNSDERKPTKQRIYIQTKVHHLLNSIK